MWLGGRVGAGEKEALVRVVRAAGPGLLAGEHPLAVAPLGAGAKSGEIASRVRLAETLAEDQLAAQDLLDVSLLLPVGAESHQRRREQRHTQAAQDARSTRLRHLLLVDRLHHGRRAAASGFFRPPQLQPSALVKAPLPVALDFGLLFLIEPPSDLSPKGFLFTSEPEIHG